MHRRRQRGKKKPFCSCKFGGAELDDSQVKLGEDEEYGVQGKGMGHSH